MVMQKSASVEGNGQDELDAFLSGRADAEVRERIGRQLREGGPLRTYLENLRVRGEKLLGHATGDLE